MTVRNITEKTLERTQFSVISLGSSCLQLVMWNNCVINRLIFKFYSQVFVEGQIFNEQERES